MLKYVIQQNMIKNFIVFSLITLLYLFIIFISSCIWGLPPYHRGFIIGFPAIYYQFNIEYNEVIWGYTNVFNLLYNVLIISAIYSIVKYFINKKHRTV